MRALLVAVFVLSLATPARAADETPEPEVGQTPDGGMDNVKQAVKEAVDREGAARLSRKALARIKEGAWADAADLFRRAHDKDPQSAAIATDFGFALAHLGRRGEAERMYRAAVEVDPNRFYAYANLAELLASDPLRWQRRDETLAFLEKALVTLASDGRARAHVELRLAELLRSLGRASDARARLQHLTAATVPAQVRRRAIELVDEVDAEAHERALEDWPPPLLSPVDHARLEKARATDDARVALPMLDELVAQRPGWTLARWERARVLEKLGQLDEASADLTIVVQLSPSHAHAWRRLGIILAQHGGGFEAERADEALRHALALEPSWSDLRELRNQVAAKRARGARKVASERAAEPTAKARQLFQDAQSWMGMEAPEMAPPLLQQALEESPGFVEAAAALFAIEHGVPDATVKALWNDGQELWRLAQAVGALRSSASAALAQPWIDRAVELGIQEARFGRASLRAAAGERTSALADLHDYLAAEPSPARLDEARALRMTLVPPVATDSPERLVHLRLAENRPREALAALGGGCHAGLPFDSLLALGKVYEFSGDAQAALVCYQQALAGSPSTQPERLQRSWQRLAAAAAALPSAELALYEPSLAAAANGKVALASFSLARLAEARQSWEAASAYIRAFLIEADADEPPGRGASIASADQQHGAETLIRRADDVGSALHAIDDRLRGLHLDRLRVLLRSGPRTTLDAGLLARWIGGGCQPARIENRARALPAGCADRVSPAEDDARIDCEQPPAKCARGCRSHPRRRGRGARGAGPRRYRPAHSHPRGRRHVRRASRRRAHRTPTGRSGPGHRARHHARLGRRNYRGRGIRPLPQVGGRAVPGAAGGADVNQATLPLFLVCEDGHEYTQRFERFLQREFRFLRVPDGVQAEAAARTSGAAGVLVDLDFRRLPAADLLDEGGPRGRPPSPEECARWSATQGILVLQYLRKRGVGLPALLFADLDDHEQAAFLERTLATLSVVSSREGLAQLAARLRAIATGA